MSAATVPAVYASALLELAGERNATSAVVESATEVLGVLRENAVLIQRVESPDLSRAQAKELISKIFADQVQADVLTFLKLLIDRDRFGSVIAILEEVVQTADNNSGIVNVHVTSAQPLDAVVSQNVSRSLGQIFGEGIVMHNSVDEDMIGGLTVRVGDYQIDGSVRRHLTEMKKRILEAPIQGDLWED